MRFWDSSAIVPLVVEEDASEWSRALARTDGDVAVWALTRTEILSAVYRKRREGKIRREDLRSALRRLSLLERAWTEVDALAPVRARADRLLGVHPLRAADALQLAAALVLVDERPKGWMFATADGRLGDAAEAEGFEVLTPAVTRPTL